MRTGIRLIRAHWGDAAIVVITLIGIVEVWANSDIEGPPAILTAFTVAWGAALLAHRREPFYAPIAALLIVCTESLIWPTAVAHSAATFVAAVTATGFIGAIGPGRIRLIGLGAAVAVAVVVTLRDPNGSWTDMLSVIPAIGFAWGVGYVYDGHRRRTAELEERAARLEREQATEARAAVAEERARIAREMHDVVAHSLSVMVVQAEAAEAMLEVDPQRAQRPLSAVQDTGREALTDLRRMLGALRAPDEGAPSLAPQPGLAGLDALAEHVREAGLPVDLRIEGEPRPLPAGIDLSAFRIVQEGLTNVLKHAGPARAEVLVRYDPDAINLEVTDDGRGSGGDRENGGHGLVGMRERVAVYGGELRAGPRPAPERGFALSARLPLEPGART
jgi:signal transduction histidine kinase